MIIGVDSYFEHVGVKGMRWGVRRAQRKEAAQRNRELNRKYKAQFREKHLATVEKARAEIKSGASKERLAKAKAQYQKDKINKGSFEARRILNKTKLKNME